eukprot:m.131423 g.131423  ORF g.131423 m.131423 type:complete len:79 (-) comp13752_c0_seq3:180-416(-)
MYSQGRDESDLVAVSVTKEVMENLTHNNDGSETNALFWSSATPGHRSPIPNFCPTPQSSSQNSGPTLPSRLERVCPPS